MLVPNPAAPRDKALEDETEPKMGSVGDGGGGGKGNIMKLLYSVKVHYRAFREPMKEFSAACVKQASHTQPKGSVLSHCLQRSFLGRVRAHPAVAAHQRAPPYSCDGLRVKQPESKD